jgi:hypothetical protein
LSPASSARTQPCSEADAIHRPRHAQKERLLNLKDEAHYGLFDVGSNDLKSALRQASKLAEFAAEVLQRRTRR